MVLLHTGTLYVGFLPVPYLSVPAQKMGGMAPQAQVWHELPGGEKEGKKEKKKRKEGGTRPPTR